MGEAWSHPGLRRRLEGQTDQGLLARLLEVDRDICADAREGLKDRTGLRSPGETQGS